MTAYQARIQKNGDGPSGWSDAPAPAEVGRRLIEGLFDVKLGPRWVKPLNQAVHWAYGTAQGSVYGLVQGTIRANPLIHGLAFGTGVWALSYAQLVPMGLYEPPWEYDARTLATDLSFHLVYGAGVAVGYEILERVGA